MKSARTALIAVVPFGDAGKSGTIAITVKSVEIGPKEDRADTSVSVRAVDASGKGTKVIMASGTAACKSETTPENFSTPGATYETCDTEGVKDGGEVGGVSFGDGDGDENDPITWKK
ncbi:hypothetical protein P3102_16585 [Amycolatopsis sp. QT-25]|uniref:hypothetical protein n=1 Tax=Amycolatopsis sp. QT-25 TaxID=3034022 RepID=UPI0023ED6AD5|nr:hypothetical protein [Amycolatopsis sp. QT-25]WET82705.1 hypothetical protein P3102_16585 [Amycolatopsis sp. QT-25]